MLRFLARFAALLILAGILPSLLRAQVPEPPPVVIDEVPTLPETVVPGRTPFPAEPLPGDSTISPNQTPEPLYQSGSSVTVITEEEIRAARQPTVAEVLRGVVGLDVVRQGGPGQLTSAFLRGGNSGQTKVLLDGIPINDPSNATRNFDFSNLLTDNIERIEVLRGPQSVIYGSDAIGGVINIVTKRGEGPLSVRALGMGGSFGTGQTGFSASGGDHVKYYSLGGSFLHTDGISAARQQNGNTERDRYRNGTLSGRYGWNLTDNLNVDYVFHWFDADAEIDNYDFGLGQPVDNFIRHNLSQNFSNRVQLSHAAFDGLVQQRLGFSLVDYHRRDTDPELGVPPVFDGLTRQVDYQANLQLAETNIFTLGAVYWHEQAESSFDPLARQNLAGVYVQDQFELLPDWFTTAGFRWDDNSRAGPAQTYRFTSVYNLNDYGSAVHGSLGTGFRAPALAENLFAFGNPNLRPEQSKGWDAGLRQQLFGGKVAFDATYFRNDFIDLIVFDLSTFTLENIGRARSSGVELTGNWFASEWTTLFANYTFDDTVNLLTGNPLERRPRNKGRVGVTQLLRDDLEATLYMLCVGDRLDTGGRVLDSYVTVNFVSAWRAREYCDLFVRVDNLTNTSYQEVFGYGTPGISVFGGASLWW